MYNSAERHDGPVCAKHSREEDEAREHLLNIAVLNGVEKLARQTVGRDVSLFPPPLVGGFNLSFQHGLDESSPVILVRLPFPVATTFPSDKVLHEAATASLIARETKVPVQKVLGYGPKSPVGPYLVLEHVVSPMCLSQRTTRAVKVDQEPYDILDADIPVETLEKLWRRVARCQLQLLRLSLPRIGSLLEVNGDIKVADRPITFSMNGMVTLANIPDCVLPQKGTTYSTADDWYLELANMHMAQLVFQHNDFVKSENDCRNKYVARQIFRRLAREGKLSSFGFAEDVWSAQSAAMNSRNPAHPNLAPKPSSVDSFRLFGEDFRAANILLTISDEIAAVIDWEFTFAAPTQFSLDPPWWLLLQKIEDWTGGLDKWVQAYEPQLATWLTAMENAEREEAHLARSQQGSKDMSSDLPVPLSRYMRESWKTGRFWLSYAACKNWVFDAIYWRFLDERFFGKRKSSTTRDDLWKTRVHMLSAEERAAMEPFVKKKLADAKERRIVNWDPADAMEHFQKHLFT